MRETVMATATHYGARVKQLRKERGWSQDRLAELANVSTRTIQRLEKGTERGQHTLLAVAQAFGMGDSELTSPDEKQFEERPKVRLVPRVRSGNELLPAVIGTGLFARGNDPLKDEDEVELVGSFIQDVRDTGEIWDEMEPKHHVEAEFRLTQSIAELEEAGFYVFASTSRGTFRTTLDPPSRIPMSLATVLVLRRDNPAMVKLPSGIEAVATPLITDQQVGAG
jgi:transcriptional regulator with XRE-family HTH domain